jgi:DNA-binding transcriptional MerR regulator
MNKNFEAYKTIGEVAKILSLSSNKRKTVNTHTIRFWEKKFKQIKPKILNGNRRYYNFENIELLKKIQFLLKDKGMTINGVQKILNNKESLKLDEISNQSIRTLNLRKKLMKISGILRNLKKIK